MLKHQTAFSGIIVFVLTGHAKAMALIVAFRDPLRRDPEEAIEIVSPLFDHDAAAEHFVQSRGLALQPFDRRSGHRLRHLAGAHRES
jgi:hypothetical protein